MAPVSFSLLPSGGKAIGQVSNMDRESQMILAHEQLAQDFQDIPPTVFMQLDLEGIITAIKDGHGIALSEVARQFAIGLPDTLMDEFVRELGRALAKHRGL